MTKFHLSVVATTRNDNHGKNLHYRMQHFVDGFVKQCVKHGLKAELILVEWNPPEDRVPLAEALRFPAEKGPCAIRIIRVPGELHRRWENAEKLPLFQMIGKNVGIRRALGRYVLATNIDILFSDGLICFLRDQLRPGEFYRADRLDIPETLPETDNFDEILQFCDDQYFRINGKYGTRMAKENKALLTLKVTAKLVLWIVKRILQIRVADVIFPIPLLLSAYKKIARHPHTNACGDFTLLSYEDWAQLKGYPEWPYYSWHIDSVLVHQAISYGIKEVDLPRKLPIYHIEHEVGSGYTHESPDALFERLKARKIPYLTNADLKDLVRQMNEKKMEFNTQGWGLGSEKLEEAWV